VQLGRLKASDNSTISEIGATMRLLRPLFSGFLVLTSFLSKHVGFSNLRFNAQHADSHCGFSDIQQGELVDNLDRTVRPILSKRKSASTRFAAEAQQRAN